MSDRWDTFDRIWAKGMNGKMRMRLMEKVKIRGLEPTEENCRDYWMGYIRFYMNPVTGIGRHVNPRKISRPVFEDQEARDFLAII